MTNFQLVLTRIGKGQLYDDTLFSLRAFPHPLRYLWTPILSFWLPFHLLRSKPPHRKHLPELGKVVGNISWCYGRI